MASKSSSPASAYLHDNLMELYTNGASPQRQRQQDQLSYPNNNNNNRQQSKQSSPNKSNQRRRSINTNASVSSASISVNSNDTKKKNKVNNQRRFLPMVNRKSRSEWGSSSDDDSADNGEYDRRKEEWRRRMSNGSSTGEPKQHPEVSLNGVHETAVGTKEVISNNGPLHLNSSTASDAAPHQFQSALGQRISQEYTSQINALSKEEQRNLSRFRLDAKQLPSPDFLRLPSTLVKLNHGWVDIRLLEQNVLQQHAKFANNTDSTSESPLMRDESQSSQRIIHCTTTIVHDKDPKVGLGMSLREYQGCIYVQGVLARDGSRIDNFNTATNGGPAYLAGMRPGDLLLGLNGVPFLKGRVVSMDRNDASAVDATSEDILKSVGDAISKAAMPMVIHYQKQPDGQSVLTLLELDKKKVQSRPNTAPAKQSQRLPSRQNENVQHTNDASPKPNKSPYIHPFAKALSQRSIIQPGYEEQVITQQIRVLCDRTRQWESKLSFRLRATDFKLRPQLDPRDVEPTYYASFFTDDKDAPPFFSYKYAKNVRSYTPSTPMIQDWRLTRDNDGGAVSPVRPPSRRMNREAAVLADLYAGLDQDDADVQDLFLGGRISSSSETIRQGGGGVAYPRSPERHFASLEREKANDIVVPLVGVRKAICVRILNSFLDSRNRTAFSIWCFDVESGYEWWAPVRYHEDFRDLRLALIKIDKSLADIPFPNLKWSGLGLGMTDAKESATNRESRRDQLECFLRSVFAEVYRGPLHPYLAEVAVHLQTFVGCDGVLTDDNESGLSLNHQVAISETTYGKRLPDSKSEPDSIARMHLKRSVQRYVYRLFLLPSVERLIARFVDETKQRLHSESTSTDQTSKHNGTTSSNGVEKIREFIDQVQDLILEGCHGDLTLISQRRDFAAINDFSEIDSLLREAVREQIELEIYVPLRTTISKYLVCAFYNEDVEMKHKMKVCAMVFDIAIMLLAHTGRFFPQFLNVGIGM
ncbi:hypothetical protein ACHAXN_009732 [Cyclotella atomus]